MQPKTFIISTLLACTALGGCSKPEARCILPGGTRPRVGDVVLRRGNGMTSMAVMAADKGGVYSHLGIVADSAGQLMVVHAVPGEPDYKGDPDRVKMETVEKFFSSINASEGRIMRCHDRAAARRAADIAVAIYRRHVLFDHDYDDRDTSRMYCCELVEHAFSKAGHPLVGPGRHSFTVPGMDLDSVMMPSDFLKSRRLTTVAAF